MWFVFVLDTNIGYSEHHGTININIIRFPYRMKKILIIVRVLKISDNHRTRVKGKKGDAGPKSTPFGAQLLICLVKRRL